MGSLVGHVAPGMGFLLIGLWQLFNHVKLHCQQPLTYTSPSWFPAPYVRHLELLLIMAGGATSVSMELFIGPVRHQPLDPDGTIPSNHLHNFEHSSISFTIFLYAALSLHLDRTRARAARELSYLLGTAAFAQELLMFHLHSTDHLGVEGQYHRLLQLLIAVCLATATAGIGYPRSFTVSFVRSVAVLFQGVWLTLTGIMLWTPALIAKGCYMNMEDGHYVVRCSDQASMDRAKSLGNLQFSWALMGVCTFSVWFYLHLAKRYPESPEYVPLPKVAGDGEGPNVEVLKKAVDSGSFADLAMGLTSIELER